MTGPIAIAPVAFGLGPASNGCAVAEALRHQSTDHQNLVGVADGMAYDHLMASGLFDAVVRASPGRLPDDLRPSVTVSILDFERAAAARDGRSHVVVVDALFWMWDALPLDPAATDGYLCPQFPGVAERVQGLSPAARAQARVIPQVMRAVDPASTASGGGRGVVLHLGGGFVPLADSWCYLRTLVDLVARATRQFRPGEALTVTGSTPVVAALADLSHGPDIQVVQLSPKAMVEAVARTALFVTLPGRNAILEGLALGAPTMLVPGLNYSQHRQVGAFGRWIESMPVFSWADLPGYGTLPAGMPEGEAGLEAMDLGIRFGRDGRAHEQLLQWLAPHIASPPSPPRLAEGAPWTSFDGAEHVARHTLSLIG